VDNYQYDTNSETKEQTVKRLKKVHLVLKSEW